MVQRETRLSVGTTMDPIYVKSECARMNPRSTRSRKNQEENMPRNNGLKLI